MATLQNKNGAKPNCDDATLLEHIADLESQLQQAKAGLSSNGGRSHHVFWQTSSPTSAISPLAPALHHLLLLSDSALPLGSFAYSSGLESYLAHHKSLVPNCSQIALFHRFIQLSIGSIASSNMPYLLSSFRNPARLRQLDNDIDASTPCTVARRASVAQGRALLNIWEKAFVSSKLPEREECLTAIAILNAFAREIKFAASGNGANTINGHFAPLWGIMSLSLGLDIQQSAYLFIFNHAKALLSAAVRAAVMGPYQAQKELAGESLQQLIRRSLDKVWLIQPEDAGQEVPPMDLWIGRHELLYSRIFNS